MKYLILLILFLLAFVPIMIISYKLARTNITNQSQANLAEGISRLESQTQRSVELSNGLLTEQAFTNLLLLTSNPSSEHYPDINTIQRKLSNWYQGQDYLQSVYLTFNNNSVLVSNDLGSHDYNIIYPQYFNYGGLSAEEWRNDLFSENYSTRFSWQPEVYNGYTSSSYVNGLILDVNTSHLKTINNSSVLTCIFNPKQIIDSMLTADVQNDGFLYIQDEKGKLVLTHNYENTEAIAEYTTLQNIDVNNEEYIIFDGKSDSFGLKIVVGISTDLFNENTKSLLALIIIYFCYGLLGILVISLYFSIKETSSIKAIMDIASNTSKASLTAKNEYQYIGSIINNISKENQQNIRKIIALNESVKASVLENLVALGAYTKKEETEIWEYFDNHFEYYCVIRFFINESSSCNPNIILNIEDNVKESINRPYVSLTPSAGEIAFIVFLEESDSGDIGIIKQAVSQGLSNIDTDGQLNPPIIHVGLSQICTAVKNVRQAYLQAEFAVNIKYNENNSGVYIYNSVRDDSQKKIFDMAILLKLNNAILAGETGIVQQLFTDIVSFAAKLHIDGQEDVQLFFSVRQSVNNACREMKVSLDDNPLPEYLSSANVIEALSCLSQTAYKLCEIINRNKKSNNELLKTGVLDYIELNCSDKSLNAGSIALGMNLAEKYVFAFVKEQTGQSLGHYIENLRIKKAEQLLLTTSYSNKKITDLVGFGSENTFYRMFAKKHGISPTKWRESHRNSH